MFDNNETNSLDELTANNIDGSYKLAVDPTEVFALKSFSQKDFE